MATARNIQIDLKLRGLMDCKQNEAAAAKVSDLVQRDLEDHHVYYNTKGFHNHMTHHLLTMYGTGASPETMQTAFNTDSDMQQPAIKLHSGVVQELEKSWASSHKYLGKPEYYTDFLSYFQNEIEKKSWVEVLLEYLLSGEERAEDLFRRSWSSFAHSWIQLMYGIEWEQPAIIAAGLAQAAIHDNYIGSFLTTVEAAAAANHSETTLSLVEALEQVHKDAKFVNSVRKGNPNTLLDGVENSCPPEGIPYLSRIKVNPEDLAEATAENIHIAAYMASSSVFHPPHIPRYDFFLIHSLTLAPLMVMLGQAAWVPKNVYHRILEWKARFDVLSYVVRWCPTLHVDEVTKYTPQDSVIVGTMEELLPHFHNSPDDGHVLKVARALILAQRISRPYSGRHWIRIKDETTWLKTMYLLFDSTKLVDPGYPWVRTAGWDAAWEVSGYPSGAL